MRPLHAILVLSLVLSSGVSAISATHSPSLENEVSIDHVGTWQAQANETDFHNASAVSTAINDGSLSRATGVNDDDLLVVELKIPSFADAVDAANGTTTTERFLTAMSEHGDLTITQTNPGPSRQAMTLDVLNGTGVRVFADATNSTYFVVLELDKVRPTRGNEVDKDALEYEPTPFLVRATLAADSPLTEDRQRAIAPVETRWASIETTPDGMVHVNTQSNLTISGKTNVGTGWPVTVVLTGSDNPDTASNESFRLTREATVEPPKPESYPYEGSFNATFRRGTIPPTAENVTLRVRLDKRSLLDESVPVEVAGQRASLTVNRVQRDGELKRVSVTASLSAGGFLVLHNGSADGPVVGQTKFLDSGKHTVAVYNNKPVDVDEIVVVAHQDTNHNEWFDGPSVDRTYTGSDQQDTDLRNSTAPPTSIETTNSVPQSETTPELHVDTTPGHTTIPGFGVSATTLALLTCVTILARR
ncbi:DUF7282 domain-containing protein [Halorussus halophilus]|uniref:DUF7282 domain-containing protein n=1 Tax=Halorussus halophilus TaxID=2650975 RepID=UPI001301216A|nr:hypothetical protein [Halorussus halophilus]